MPPTNDLVGLGGTLAGSTTCACELATFFSGSESGNGAWYPGGLGSGGSGSGGLGAAGVGSAASSSANALFDVPDRAQTLLSAAGSNVT